ncbi:MAG: peptidoglycan-binding domain-containing protein [Minisyncoccota bacterium]
MKKIVYTIAFICMIIPTSLFAQTEPFLVSLGRGSVNKEEVFRLQKFLVSEGFLSVSPTGNYLSLTVAAVKAFQQSQGVESTGYFGPLSRAAANNKLAQSSTPKSSVSVSSVTSEKSLIASIFFSSAKKIQWKTSDYPAKVGVNINLLNRVSDSPVRYDVVRQIAKDTPNDGEETWIPTSSEKNLNLYVEVTCSTTYTFKEGCQISQTPIKVQ